MYGNAVCKARGFFSESWSGAGGEVRHQEDCTVKTDVVAMIVGN
jgi:hypothetical protein